MVSSNQAIGQAARDRKVILFVGGHYIWTTLGVVCLSAHLYGKKVCCYKSNIFDTYLSLEDYTGIRPLHREPTIDLGA